MGTVWQQLRKETLLSKWTLTFFTTHLMFMLQTPDLMDSFPVLKSVCISPELCYTIRVANVLCNASLLGWNLPKILNTASSLTTVLNMVSGSKMCSGCSNDSYNNFAKDICDKDGIVKGTARVLSSAAAEDSRSHRAYFSKGCLGIIPYSKLGKICEECLALDTFLRVRLHRSRDLFIDTSKDVISTAWCHLSSTQLIERITEQHRRRQNAEKREKYLRHKLSMEKNSKQLIEKDHRDLRIMMAEIENDCSKSEMFPDDPTMSMFWDIQKERMKGGSRAWEPK